MNDKAKLFAAVPDEERRRLRIPVLVTANEKSQIEHNASIRSLSASDYMRRVALGRKADVRYDTQIVLALTEVVQSIRTLNLDLVAMQIQDTDKLGALLDTMREAIGEAKAALLRIDK